MINESIAHYKITSKLGQGGMGEVYRAMDTKLDREVAIKILPETFVGDRNRIARFHREAKVLATLNHPNIAVIYSIEKTDDTHALVMELIEGDTLGERLKREPMTVEEALDCCKQIAEALEAAHERGIVHRDLKPENVKISEDGHVKVLDFGLAKEVINPDSEDRQGESPTLTHMITVPGELLGTAPYMSPEQARARPVDKRSDIWSFGCVLYECMTGKPLFSGEDVTETLASIIKGEPHWEALPRDTPPTIELLLRKCLNKDRKRRLQHIGDARVDIEQALGDPTSSIIRLSDRAIRDTTSRSSQRRLLITAVILSSLITGILVWQLKPRPPQSSPNTRDILISLEAEMADLWCSVALSPDGQELIYVSGDPRTDGRPLRVRSLDTLEEREIPGTEKGFGPFFSPDGKSLGFATPHELRIVSLEEGAPRTLAKATYCLGAHWGSDGTVVFNAGEHGGLMTIPASGGQPTELTRVEGDELTHILPQFLPDGRHVLFTTALADPYYMQNRNLNRIEVVNLSTGLRTTLKEGVEWGAYISSGHLIYRVDEAVFGVAFDLKQVKSRGQEKVVIHGSRILNHPIDGTLIYDDRDDTAGLVWVSASGDVTSATDYKGSFRWISLSRDSRKVAMDVSGKIHILDLQTHTLMPFTLGESFDSAPLWSTDDQWIFFASHRERQFGIWRKRTDFSEKSTNLFTAKTGQLSSESISRDGNMLFGMISTSTAGWDIWGYDLEAAQEFDMSWLNSEYPDVWPSVSPDGKWIAFDRPVGTHRDVYVRSLDGTGEPQLIRMQEGWAFRPQWSWTNDRIFFEHGNAIMVVPITINNNVIVPGLPEKVVDLPPTARTYDWCVDANDQRFLVLVEGVDPLGRAPSQIKPNRVNIIFNWFSQLTRQLPVAE